ncbi:uncharacterized protein LMH87_009029 [Akanthomyces muscarius]|uniref:Uncharacterized protein n=1 Tax=Akanthomyces muscarius TaxID=2231603 RepID=A0A9W8QHG8_AKAMU|nr:uncharacterized protein LMH87_009029 [Akanthomyces muscarius]KAJ4158506.1 hypothetical protein LMH87_009029 [Akanthomyces muscarius]
MPAFEAFANCGAISLQKGLAFSCKGPGRFDCEESRISYTFWSSMDPQLPGPSNDDGEQQTYVWREGWTSRWHILGMQ